MRHMFLTRHPERAKAARTTAFVLVEAPWPCRAGCNCGKEGGLVPTYFMMLDPRTDKPQNPPSLQVN
jgi:hypothetical protein